VRIAEPLGHVGELGLSVQGYLEHDRTLKELLAASFGGGDEDPTESVRATATALAAVHTSGVVHGDVHSWEDELASQLKKHDKLAAAVPWLAEHTAGVPDRLEAAGRAEAADPPGASHGSFRTAQVLLGAGPVAIIDFDKLRQAEPAADIGPFLAKLRHTAVNKGGDELPDEATAAAIGGRVDDLRREVLDAYRADGTVSPSRLACWEGLEYLSLVLGSAKKGLPERAASCATMLHRHLEACSI
jgi:aminoglycoside phosphotransferase (APT) family kinase protein